MQPLVVNPIGYDSNVGEREAAKRRIHCRRCMSVGLCCSFVFFLFVNVVVWVVYEKYSKTDYVWPKWVSLGTAFFFGFHLANTLPFICPVPCISQWLTAALANLAVVNVVVWLVWAVTKCKEEDKWNEDDSCDYMWPMWVSGASAALAVILCCFCPVLQAFGLLGDVHEDHIDDEVRRNRREQGYDSESD